MKGGSLPVEVESSDGGAERMARSKPIGNHWYEEKSQRKTVRGLTKGLIYVLNIKQVEKLYNFY